MLVAYALSPLTPVGEARLAEPSTGLAFDPFVLLIGALVTVLVVLLLGLWPSVRASQVHIGDDRALQAHRLSIMDRLAGSGAPPSASIGVRHALERGGGAATIPVGTALFGTVIAVLALCATAVFGASLSHLTATPALYGTNYQLSFSNTGQPGVPTGQVADLERDHAISGITLGTRNEISINGVSIYSLPERLSGGHCCCRRSPVGPRPTTAKSFLVAPPCTRLAPRWGRSST